MSMNPREVIDMLKMEIAVIERGGYLPSVREPRTDLRVFRDSVSCPNLALEEKSVPCAHCWLAQYIPASAMNSDEPCHHIPLNDRGETVAAFLERGDREGALRELLAWLKSKVAELERQLATA